MSEENKQELITKYTERAGLKGKITAMCISCIYDPSGKGNWRMQVSECTSELCPLHSVRPLSSKYEG